jgi:hypothetical protein
MYSTATFTVGTTKGDICYREGRAVAVIWADEYEDGTAEGVAGGFRGHYRRRDFRLVEWTYTAANEKVTVSGEAGPIVFDIRKGGLFLIAVRTGSLVIEQRAIDLTALPPATDPGGAAAAGERLAGLAATDEAVAAFLRNAGGAK